MQWHHINYYSVHICDIHNHCRRETGLSSSYSLQTTQVKLAFFAPNYKKYTFKFMPFDPMISPSFYTCMIGELRIKWHALLLDTVRKRKVIRNKRVRVTDAYEIYLNSIKTFSGRKVIIDDILRCSTNIDLICLISNVYARYSKNTAWDSNLTGVNS